MSKTLITGAGGFIGSHLTEMLVEEGLEVKAFLKYNSTNNYGWLENSKYKNNIEFVMGDVRDYDSVSKAVKGCDSVFHLAALIGIPYSYESPLAYIRTNIEGTYNVLESAKLNNCSNILVTSTSETYGTAQYVPIDENHPSVGQSPYSATKIAADQIATSYYRSFNLPIKIVRPFNTYGPRQSSRAIIPTVVTQILSGEKKLKLGNLTPTRDLTFVKDTALGFIEIFKSAKLFGEPVNIGMAEEISINELVKKIAEIMNIEIEILQDEQRIRPENSEVERLFACNDLLKDTTNWNPRYNLDKGLTETIKWLEKNIDLYKPEKYVV